MTTNGNGNGPTWRLIAIASIGALFGVLTWYSQGLAQDVKALDKRVQVLEVLVAGDIATIKTQLQGITQIVSQRP